MSLPYEALRTFLAVAQAGSFTGAARQLGVSQPWVSQRVAQLEAYLSRKRRDGPLQLLERRRRGVVLTPDGVMLRDLAADSLRKLEQLEDAFESRRGAFHGRVRIAASSTMLLYLVPEAVRRFRETYPNVRLETHHTNSPLMARQVLDDEVDLAIGDPGDTLPPGVRVEVVRSCARVLAAPVGDPLLRLHPPLHAEQLRDRDWIVLRDFSLTRHMLDALLGSYSIAMEVEHWEVMKTYIALGVGVGLMPDLCILPADRNRLDSIALGREFGRSSFCVLVRKQRVLAPAVLAFIGLISPAVAQRLSK
ncbi:MAG: LysR family transcriptional regulator [Planctomycetia bacterium]|nr:LysR family transcriptional regulator [Planctomycetia bacterium]